VQGPRGVIDEVFEGQGTRIVAVLCTYELVALPEDSPVPTISEIVEEHPAVGIAIIAALAYHWWGQRNRRGSTC
jgi:hypothetical protein